MKSMIVTMTSKNQVSLPAKVMRNNNILPGANFQFEVIEGAFVLRPLSNFSNTMKDVWKITSPYIKGKATDDEIAIGLEQYHKTHPHRGL